MHLLSAQSGEISDGSEPVDIGQSPADLIVISAADSELAMLAEAREALARESSSETVSLRLVKLDWLTHPYSVDSYLDETALGSQLVVARILGGEGYWPYGLEQFAGRLCAAGVGFAALPGDDKPDEALFRASTVTREPWETLLSYLVEGGLENAKNFLRYAAHVIHDAPPPPGPQPLLRAGVYGAEDLPSLAQSWKTDSPVAAIVFYRSLMLGGGLAPIDALISSCHAAGLNALPVFVASLKDPVSVATLERLWDEAHTLGAPPAVVLNATAFAVGSFSSEGARAGTPLDTLGRPVLQVALASATEASWTESLRGLSARDIAMNVALPEVDGRIFTRAIGFKGEAVRDDHVEAPVTRNRAQPDRANFVAQLAANWVRLGAKTPSERRVGLVFANYPTKDGRIANGVGLDAPASAVKILAALKTAGYAVSGAPTSSSELMAQILAGPTNDAAALHERSGGETYALEAYDRFFNALPDAFCKSVTERWGAPSEDRRVRDGAFRLAVHRFGGVALGLQPARGYDVDPAESLHSPDLPPTHAYLAFYAWMREAFGCDAIVHLGKHGSMEWLPGKALALSDACAPEAVFGPTPHLYPFIVNDPGEGAQAKRRSQAVIVDHLTPPMTRAESHGAAASLEGLVDEFYEAATLDPRRADHLKKQILSLAETDGLAMDAGLDAADDEAEKLQRLDAYLCDLKEAQIRDGLHIFGASPDGGLATDLIAALARLPRGAGAQADASLLRALCDDLLAPAEAFDPLDCAMAAPWSGARPEALATMTQAPWRSAGDTVERLELLAAALIAGERSADPNWTATRLVLGAIEDRIRPAVATSGPAEMAALLAGLDGRFVPPGPSGAPTRGRLDVLPTGRNFYSVDSRALPTQTAWALGWNAAALLLERHLQEEGEWPKAIAMTAWGTSNMRTGGDDLAQALALMGVRPRWDAASHRAVGFEVIPLETLGRPRVDVTLRISGFFRDAFPMQVDLIDSAARAIQGLDEEEEMNPAAARARREAAQLVADGLTQEQAARRAGARVYGSKPGAYGAGLQALIDERVWSTRADLGAAYVEWGGYAYGGGDDGVADARGFESRLGSVDAVLHNQDNREHDILDSDDYYQFEGGVAAAVETISGQAPKIYHGDHSRPERPVIRTLAEEIGRVVRSRVANPKWIAGVQRHGYKGAFEIAATVDYLFAFAATTRAVSDHHFDITYAAILEDEKVRDFIEEANAPALSEIRARFREAIERGLWRPKSNSARRNLAAQG